MWALGLQCGHRTLTAEAQGRAAVGKRREGNSLILLLENQGSSTLLTVQHTLLDTPPPTLTAGTWYTEDSKLTHSIPCHTRALRGPGFTFLVHPSFTVMHSPNKKGLSLIFTVVTDRNKQPTEPYRKAVQVRIYKTANNSGLPFNEEHRLWSLKDRALNPGSSLP